jgi:ribA/ribD-fused uncharacterized protein
MSYIDSFKGRFYFLSNFYPCRIEHQGIIYPSVEHYYVALKVNTLQFLDGKYYTAPDFRELIAKVPLPQDVKKIGQRVKLRVDWNEKKYNFMLQGIRQKFSDEKLSELLLDTGDSEIIESNWWHDNYWGRCSCPKCKDTGQNNLGKIIMQVRLELKQKQRPSLGEQISGDSLK